MMIYWKQLKLTNPNLKTLTIKMLKQQQPEQEELEIELESIYKDLENNREVLNLNKVDLKGIKKDENK